MMDKTEQAIADAIVEYEFALLYGRYPKPDEMEEMQIQYAEWRATKAIRPGFLNMVRYWLA